MSNLNLSQTFSPIGGNQYYSRIHRGTSSAFDSGSIQSAQNPSDSPFQVIDVNVDLSAGVQEGQLIPLATSGIPYGCIVRTVTLNGNGSIPGAEFINLLVGVAHGSVTDPNKPLLQNFNQVIQPTPVGPQPGTPGVDVNGGVIAAITGNYVPRPPSPDDELPKLPVIRVAGEGSIPPFPGATLRVKIVYISL